MTTHPPYKTVSNGSIDYAHYIQHSHQIRSNNAHSLLKLIWRWVAENLMLQSTKPDQPVENAATSRPIAIAGTTSNPARPDSARHNDHEQVYSEIPARRESPCPVNPSRFHASFPTELGAGTLRR